MRILGFVDSAYALIGTLARIIISAVLHLKRVRAICCKTPSSLKPLSSEILFVLCNKQKSSFNNVTTSTPLAILEIPDDALLHMMFY